MAEVGSPRARVLLGAGIAILAHGGVLLALRPAAALPAVDPVAAARAERSALLRTAEGDVATGRATLGETLVRLEWLDRVEEDGHAAPAEREAALGVYRALLADVRAGVAGGEPVEHAIAAAVAKDGRAARYKRMYPRLADALARGGGNCVALSSLAVALAYDAGSGTKAAFRVYANHVAPEVNGFRFGMAKRCHGPGEVVAGKDLIAAYAAARASGGKEPFALPVGTEACDDPGEVFGA